MNKPNRTFEETYPTLAFAPLVYLGIQLGKFFGSALHGTRVRNDRNGRSFPANGATSLR